MTTTHDPPPNYHRVEPGPGPEPQPLRFRSRRLLLAWRWSVAAVMLVLAPAAATIWWWTATAADVPGRMVPVVCGGYAVILGVQWVNGAIGADR